jgi:hypothetical protein
MPKTDSPTVGMKKMAEMLKQEFPDLTLGYFNQPLKQKGRRLLSEEKR